MQFPFEPGFHLGPLYITYYGIILMVGALAGAMLAASEAKRRGLSTKLIWGNEDGPFFEQLGLLVWLIIGGVIGARLWHIFTPSASSDLTTMYYLTHPLDALAIWKGGLGIPGAVIGGAVALYFWGRKYRQSFGVWADIVAPAVALGQAIGRWGNFTNNELYGAPTSLPWKLYIPASIDGYHFRLPGFGSVDYYHPLFLYESLWNLGNMFLLLWIGHRFSDRLKRGDLFLVYLVMYPIGRFLLEFLRLDTSTVMGININQAIMAVVAVAASAALVWRHRPDTFVGRAPAVVPAARKVVAARPAATVKPAPAKARKTTTRKSAPAARTKKAPAKPKPAPNNTTRGK